jgi:ribosomal protein S18 acetylase RimI-like enzyme
MNVEYRNNLEGVNWPALKAALAADNFDNGRTPEQLQRSFQNSHAVSIAWLDGEIVATARALSDEICNAYLVDIWTISRLRRRGIAREMVTRLLGVLAGQHVYLQVDLDLIEFYHRVGFAEQPYGMSRVIGRWLVNEPLSH